MIIKILIGLAALIAVFAIVVALRPSDFRVERSITIAAAPADLFPHLNDLRKAHVWSPWVELDRSAKYSFEGAPSGKGAIGAWDGDKNVGAGRQTIVESRPYELVRTRLDFERPFKSTANADFLLKPQGNQTVVTWTMYGSNSSFMCKAIGLVMNCDKMIGDTFEKGLANLKQLTETPAPALTQR